MRLILMLLLFFLCFSSLLSQELKLILDSKKNFKFIQDSSNITFERDVRGLLGVYLDRYKAVLDLNNIDLRLEIGRDNKLKDTSSNYLVSAKSLRVSNEFRNVSNGSLIFYSNQNSVKFKPLTKKAFFFSGNTVSDFTIKFWVYRTTSVTGEIIFSWDGYKNINNLWVDQSIRLESDEGNFVWVLNNVFLKDNKNPIKIRMKSNDDFIPKKWHLHTLRYRQRDGILEYLIDSKPQAIEYVTDDKKEGSGYLLSIGNFIDFTLGTYFTGAVENLEIHKSFEEVSNAFFSKNMGYIITEPIKLSKYYSQILSFDVDSNVPKDTEIVYYYRLDNKVFYDTDSYGNIKKNLTGAWIHFDPKKDFPDSKISKYIQIKVEFYPSGDSVSSPSLYSMSITYVPEAAPFPPVITKVIPGSREVFIEWIPVVNSSVEGYYIYIGVASGNYHGKTSGVLTSPIDVGNQTSFKITGLEDGRLYYISIAAYNLDKSVNKTSFSKEISVRPMEIFKKYE
nr:fibronectin type III domain-containing protein [Borreliella afzelii]